MGLVDHLERCGLFSDFQYGCQSSQSTADLLTVISNGITRTFDISKAFNRVWHTDLLHKLKSYRILRQIFALISSFLSNRQLQVVLDGKSSHEYSVNVGVPQSSNLGAILHFSYYTLIIFLMLSVILLSMLMILISTLSVIMHLICGNN